MKFFSVRKHALLWARLFTAGLFLVLLFFVFRKYENGLYTDPVLSLRINEVCTINPGTTEGDSVTYEDYIELYNPTSQAVSLEGLYLSDDAGDPLQAATRKERLSREAIIPSMLPARGSAPEGTPSVAFGLSEEEVIMLTWVCELEDGTESAHTIDSVYVPASISPGAVYAATEDGGDSYGQLSPSPGLSNASASASLETLFS